MKKYFTSAFVLFLIVAVVAWLSRIVGWYNDYWYTDVILHTISGVALGLLWLGWNKKYRTVIQASATIFVGIISFAVLGSVLWEFWEFFGWHITPSHTQFYIPELGDTLQDIFCGLVGGSIVALIDVIIKYSK